MKRANKTLRRKRHQKQRSRRRGKRHTRRHRGGSLPVPAGALVAVSTSGEYGIPLLISKEKYEDEKEKESLGG